jgi:hypothetical protein
MSAALSCRRATSAAVSGCPRAPVTRRRTGENGHVPAAGTGAAQVRWAEPGRLGVSCGDRQEAVLRVRLCPWCKVAGDRVGLREAIDERQRRPARSAARGFGTDGAAGGSLDGQGDVLPAEVTDRHGLRRVAATASWFTRHARMRTSASSRRIERLVAGPMKHRKPNRERDSEVLSAKHRRGRQTACCWPGNLVPCPSHRPWVCRRREGRDRRRPRPAANPAADQIQPTRDRSPCAWAA